MILFQTIIPHVIINQNIWRPINSAEPFILIPKEETLLRKNENFLVAMILFQIIIRCGIINQNICKPLEQSPLRLKERNKIK